ncbi:hypothetical protein HYY75_00545, partial [bacterium]|nr:hypothetical protein [bacterium]
MFFFALKKIRFGANRGGYLLLSLILFFSVLALSNSAGILEQDTKLKRFKEGEFKQNLDSIRRGIDLFRYKYTVTNPDPGKITQLDTAFSNGATDLIVLLASESFISYRTGSDTAAWRVVQNLLKNGSFEDDSATDYGLIGTWQGNFTPNDGVPNGWELNADGAQQSI